MDLGLEQRVKVNANSPVWVLTEGLIAPGKLPWYGPSSRAEAM